MVEMSCEEHDRHAASTQFITHTVGRVLGQMSPQSTPIDTKGYQSLLNLVDNTNNDSFELYYGLFMYNPVSPLPEPPPPPPLPDQFPYPLHLLRLVNNQQTGQDVNAERAPPVYTYAGAIWSRVWLTLLQQGKDKVMSSRPGT